MSEADPSWAIAAGGCAGGGAGKGAGLGGVVVARGAGDGAGTCFGAAVLAAGFGRTMTGVTGALETTGVTGDSVCVGVEWCDAVWIVGA